MTPRKPEVGDRLYQIKNRLSGRVLFELVCGSLKLCVEAAVGRGAHLGDADLRGAYLGGADLRGADLGGADLRGAYLGDADLGDADLRGADLRGAYLRGADLGGADLRGADLGGADLRGADLRGAYLGDAGQDSRGYRFVGQHKNGEVRVLAGCHDFTVAEARAHWSDPDYHGGPIQAAECLAKVDLIVATAKARGWLDELAEGAGS